MESVILKDLESVESAKRSWFEEAKSHLTITPEVIAGRGYTEKSDIYSVAMLMWEISSGQPPFINYEHNYDLAMDIVAGKRPKIVKIFSFNNLPEPRNATKDELEGYHSIQNDLGIPNTNDIMYNNKIEQNDENEPEDSALK
ncbi:unnamed protein product [Rhizophagus irregularis]|nr:unnamed protein product [Rhizophagus irregularis]